MQNIINYFYIFSKLTTSLVLILIIFVLGYTLFQSYNETDNFSNDWESRLKLVSDIAYINNENLEKMNVKLDKSNTRIIDIKNMLKNNNFDEVFLKYKKDINDLININKDLQNQINKISLNLNQSNIGKISNTQIDLDKQISSLIKLILIKYKNGEDTKNDLSFLESLVPKNNAEIFEKLNLVQVKEFYGFENLKKLFDLSTKEYVNFKFLTSNKNSTLKYIFRFISIKPNNLTIYENEDLNILKNANKYLDLEDIESSIKQVMYLEEYENFFDNWLLQAKTFLEFKNEISKVN